jgi:hypothetical protein
MVQEWLKLAREWLNGGPGMAEAGKGKFQVVEGIADSK